MLILFTHLLRTHAQQRMGANHLHADAAQNRAVLVRVGIAMGADDGDHALARAEGIRKVQDRGKHRKGHDQPASAEPEQVDHTDDGSAPHAAGFGEEQGHADEDS